MPRCINPRVCRRPLQGHCCDDSSGAQTVSWPPTYARLLVSGLVEVLPENASANGDSADFSRRNPEFGSPVTAANCKSARGTRKSLSCERSVSYHPEKYL